MTNNTTLRRVMKSVMLIGVLFAAIFASSTYADGSILSLKEFTGNLTNGMGYGAQIIQYIAIIAGVGFVFGAFHKFHANKMNPTQVPLSQGITMLLIGSALLVFPTLLETGSKMMIGDNAKVAQIGGHEINDIISTHAPTGS